MLIYGPLDHISLKGNKLACSVKIEDSLKLHDRVHDSWKKSYVVHVSAQKISTRGKKNYVLEFEILSAQ